MGSSDKPKPPNKHHSEFMHMIVENLQSDFIVLADTIIDDAKFVASGMIDYYFIQGGMHGRVQIMKYCAGHGASAWARALHAIVRSRFLPAVTAIACFEEVLAMANAAVTDCYDCSNLQYRPYEYLCASVDVRNSVLADYFLKLVTQGDINDCALYAAGMGDLLAFKFYERIDASLDKYIEYNEAILCAITFDRTEVIEYLLPMITNRGACLKLIRLQHKNNLLELFDQHELTTIYDKCNV